MDVHVCTYVRRYMDERTTSSDHNSHLAGPTLLLWLVQHDHVRVLLGTALLPLGILLQQYMQER